MYEYPYKGYSYVHRSVHWTMTSRISQTTRERIAQAWPLILDALANGAMVRDTLREHGISRPMLAAFLAGGDAQLRKDWRLRAK